MKNTLGFKVVYYANNYLLSFNLLIGLFLTYRFCLALFSGGSYDHSDNSILLNALGGISLLSAILCAIGLFRSFLTLDAIRLGKKIDDVGFNGFRITAILLTIAGLCSLFKVKTPDSNSLVAILIPTLPTLTISEYGLFLLLAGQFFFNIRPTKT